MKITRAKVKEKVKIMRLDPLCPPKELTEQLSIQKVYALWDDKRIVGVLRYSLFWQKIPFLDHLLIDPEYRGRGLGKRMMIHWENMMSIAGYSSAMLSTQEDEKAQDFYKHLGYEQIGSFKPPGQDVNELILSKNLPKSKFD